VEYIGNGIYTYSEASKITGINAGTLRRWLEGYNSPNSDKVISPIFRSDYKKVHSKKVLSFLDLIEILFIKSFRKHGLSMPLIRKAVNRASKLLSSSHPFAMKKFYTDGKTILARIAKESHMPELIDLITNQYQFDPIVFPELYECIDFNDYEIAERWWPEGKDNYIMVDPNINFGKPSISSANIPTNTIYELYTAGHSIDELADWYDVSFKDIESAIGYENKEAA
jgi:uncharacterized protein (DUF433 family)/DNA-binding transcriptional MerR regulator